MRVRDRILGATLALFALITGGCGATRGPQRSEAEPQLASDPAKELEYFRARRAIREGKLGDRGVFESFPQRPVASRSYAWDYAALPLRARARRVEEGEQPAGVPIVQLEGSVQGSRAAVRGDWLIDVQSAGLTRMRRAFTEPASDGPLARLGFSVGAFSAEVEPPGLHMPSPLQRSQRACGFMPEGEIGWEGFGTERWLADGLDHVSVYGRLDARTCAIKPRWLSQVRAAALIEGVLYAFRECKRACGAGDPAREELLVVIGPPAIWSGASPSSGARPVPEGSFSQIAIPLRRGGSGSLLFSIEGTKLSRFLMWRGAPPKWNGDDVARSQTIQLAIDLLWPSEAALPTATGYALLVTPRAELLLEAPALRGQALD